MVSENDLLIEVKDLRKEFKVLKKNPGLAGALRSLFSRNYQIIEAIKDISFSIHQGELVGYVGPNGAGKSTTIKILCGILFPTSGIIKVAGFTPSIDRRKFAMKLGVMFGQRTQLWWDLPVSESFDLLKSIYKIEINAYRKNLEFFNDIFGLSEFWGQPVRRLSLGQRVRADLAAALIHDPNVLLLDEPTIGLDVLARSRFRELIKMVNREKKTTILLTSHDLGDIEMIVHRLILIDKGAVKYDGTLKKFLKDYGGQKNLLINFSSPPRIVRLPAGAEILNLKDNFLEIKIDTAHISYHDLLKVLPKWGNVIDIQLESDSLETILSDLYKK
ncbi:MAG: ATP-binding cassette domain-containing protein [Spirochaetia bacterium]|nr:ATP-binding cassette domain-containing protein [Spirochaetia bacterium]